MGDHSLGILDFVSLVQDNALEPLSELTAVGELNVNELPFRDIWIIDKDRGRCRTGQ